MSMEKTWLDFQLSTENLICLLTYVFFNSQYLKYLETWYI